MKNVENGLSKVILKIGQQLINWEIGYFMGKCDLIQGWIFESPNGHGLPNGFSNPKEEWGR